MKTPNYKITIEIYANSPAELQAELKNINFGCYLGSNDLYTQENGTTVTYEVTQTPKDDWLHGYLK